MTDEQNWCTSNSLFLLRESHIAAYPSLSPVTKIPDMLRIEMEVTSYYSQYFLAFLFYIFKLLLLDTYDGLNIISFTVTRWCLPSFPFGWHRKAYLCRISIKIKFWSIIRKCYSSRGALAGCIHVYLEDFVKILSERMWRNQERSW